MAKHGTGQAPDFQGFLNDLQDWELSLNEKDRKMKPQISNKIADSFKSKSGGYDYLRNYDAGSLVTEESCPDANSEKELGNEYFKQKKFKEAIDCYSRSIAFSPTAVAYANRAMAYLKIRRQVFQEAEDDCSEALNLDDRYIKAYSRRATARRELQRFKQSMDDAEFALRIEPYNQEIKKQYTEVQSLYEKVSSSPCVALSHRFESFSPLQEILQKASGGALRSFVQGVAKVGKLETKVNGHGVHSVPNSGERIGIAVVQEDHAPLWLENNGQVPMKASISVEEIGNKSLRAGSRTEGLDVDSSYEDAKRNHRTEKQELKESVKELALRAASRAMAEAAKNIGPPNSAYEFEVLWQGFYGDRKLQASLLKVTSPTALPQIFKDSLSAPILIEIIKCVATFFTEEMDLAVKYLVNLTKVPRFSVLIMCLSSTEKADLLKMWNEVFYSNATPIEPAEILDNLRLHYRLEQ
ncbi:TPR_11 domain-containing protein/RPAP3_C domain-containing protein [Cephalotus follicularis]|uniref:TPR_11 domain-containing protein/RPAP3_C domain-containing protein n=1 Tax=Cephalotus follicularis TaxID=3775 RepID=A0A1Q3DCV4_CEPFO|nr:TPR_11 domain-containing protein/RPAP3_C domain-containing protein [Cephalotus follicularis]